MKKIFLSLIFLFMTSGCPLMAQDFSYVKPDIDDKKILTEAEQKIVKDALTNQGQRLIDRSLTPAKNDYTNNFDRGTVYFNPEKGNKFAGENEYKVRNYSYYKVIIPDGTVLNNINFSQKNPHTIAIQGKNLHFIRCNLNNVELDPTWTYEHTLKIHSRHRLIEDNGKQFDVYEVEKDGKFMEVQREEIIAGDDIITP